MFFDTSALLKRYLNEKGNAEVKRLFEEADKVFVSIITHIECASSFQRLLFSKYIDKKEVSPIDYGSKPGLSFF